MQLHIFKEEGFRQFKKNPRFTQSDINDKQCVLKSEKIWIKKN